MDLLLLEEINEIIPFIPTICLKQILKTVINSFDVQPSSGEDKKIIVEPSIDRFKGVIQYNQTIKKLCYLLFIFCRHYSTNRYFWFKRAFSSSISGSIYDLF
jgi:hypothetical protein